MLPTWLADYVGLPWRKRGRDRTGVDCYGLCALFWRERYGLDLPSYTDRYADTAEFAEMAAIIRGEVAEHWQRVPLTEARLGDGILLRVEGEPSHIGVVVAPDAFLHVLKGIGSCIERLSGPHWNRRILGVYRHRSLA